MNTWLPPTKIRLLGWTILPWSFVWASVLLLLLLLLLFLLFPLLRLPCLGARWAIAQCNTGGN